MTDIIKSNLPKKHNHELAEELLGQFPSVDRAALLKRITAWYFCELRYGNKREERGACHFLNQLQVEAERLLP